MKQALDLGYPVIIGFEVFQSFYDMFNGGTGIWDTNYGTDWGGHATTLVGYDNNRGMFKVQNQWGTIGGDNGFFWIPYTFVQSNCLKEAYILYATNQLTPMDITPNSNVCTSLQYAVSNLPTGSTVQWSGSNPLIATVSPTGLVTKVSSGSIILTAVITNCGASNPITITKNVLVGDASGYFTINPSATQYALGSYKYITAQRGANVNLTFNATSGNISNLQWSWDNWTSTANPATINLTAPSTGYTTVTKYVYLDGLTGCGTTRLTTTIAITSMGWSYAMIATPNPVSTNINVSVTKVNDTVTTVSTVQPTALQSSVTTNTTKMSLYNFNTNALVKQWTYNESTSLNYNLNIAGVPKGYYVLKMERDNKITTTKILVQ